MKKTIVSTIMALIALLPTSAFAAPADVSSTSNFTLTVVEATIGLTITGSTTQSDVISKTDGSSQSIVFPNLTIENSGNTKGALYAQTLTPEGIDFGSGEGQLASVSVNAPGTNTELTETEAKLSDFMDKAGTDGDTLYMGPGEESEAFSVIWVANGQFPVGNISVPIKWTMKAN